MIDQKTLFEKIRAVLFVIFLFLIVGSILGTISLNNKKQTQTLKQRILQQKIARENQQKLENINLLNFDPQKISAKSFLTIATIENQGVKILSQKNATTSLPIASITKLMTAVIATENIDLNKEVKATKDYVGGDGTNYMIEIGQIYKAKALLENMLISSDNDSARLLSSFLGENKFVALMNKKAKLLNLKQTNFVNVTGLDDQATSTIKFNISSAENLADLLFYINKYHPEILRYTHMNQYDFCDILKRCQTVKNTNQLLGEENLPLKILGGKTGQTIMANKNLALFAQTSNGVYIINIVLGSIDHFKDTEEIINHITENK